MAQICVNLLVLAVGKKQMRYIIVGAEQNLSTPTPLFLGADVMDGSGILSSNHCRIHARYGRKGLATKLLFPIEVTLNGVTNTQSGVWFYSMQGALKAAFEYQDHETQVAVLGQLQDVWKHRQNNPDIPDCLHVSAEHVQRRLTYQYPNNLACQLASMRRAEDSGFASPADDTAVESSGCQEKACELCDTNMASFSLDGEIGDSRRPFEASATAADMFDSTIPDIDSLQWFLKETINRTQAMSRRCQDEDKPLIESLLSFLEILRKCQQPTTNAAGEFLDDGAVFTSFLEVIIDYSHLVRQNCRLRSFESSGVLWDVGARRNALLCLVSEWLGKQLHLLNVPVGKRVEDFKMENISYAQNIPLPHLLVYELFPDCMLLLLGHWMGLYSMERYGAAIGDGDIESQSAMPTCPCTSSLGNSSGRKQKLAYLSGQSRDDHSYSSPVESTLKNSAVLLKNEELTSAAIPTPPSKKARTSSGGSCLGTVGTVAADCGSRTSFKDHNYFSNAHLADSCGIPNSLREDHTYVANMDAAVADSGTSAVSSPSLNVSPPGMRKDHTYVATHSRKLKAGVPSSICASKDENVESNAATQPLPSDTSEITNCLSDKDLPFRRLLQAFQGRRDEFSVVADPSKYKFMQLVLEFITSSLVSGVAHVVYTSLTYSEQ